MFGEIRPTVSTAFTPMSGTIRFVRMSLRMPAFEEMKPTVSTAFTPMSKTIRFVRVSVRMKVLGKIRQAFQIYFVAITSLIAPHLLKLGPRGGHPGIWATRLICDRVAVTMPG